METDMERTHFGPDRLRFTAEPSPPKSEVAGLDELLTVEEVAALLKVSKSWVYEHTRSRGVPRSERLPYIKLGKYVRFEAASVQTFLVKLSKIA
jgi:excisionase family DNA binding protein